MTQVFQSYYAFLNREDKTINGVDKDFSETHFDYEKQNETNKGCWNCSRCSGCSDCSRLQYESDEKSNIQISDTNPIMGYYPKIENIHQKIYEAAMQPL
jgi:hypothetical protein